MSQGWLRIATYTHQQLRVAAMATPPKHLVLLLFDKMHVCTARSAARFFDSIALIKTATADQIAYQHGAGARLLFILAFACSSKIGTK
nr:hypothetical protein [Janthinobacterium sp. Marseille]